MNPSNMYRIPTSGVDSQIVELAAWVAEECLWPRAAHYDESGSYPVESWRDLWKHGLLAAAAPGDYGGLGLDMPTYTSVIERLAYGCANTAMTMHMHSVVLRFIEALATPEQKGRLYAEVVDDGKLFGSWGSEPGRRGGSRAARGTILAPVDGGYVINGVKHFCSMAGAAHRNMVHCDMEGSKDGDGFQLVLVPNGVPGMEISGEWNVLGMRATVSPTVTFRDWPRGRGCPPGPARYGPGQGRHGGLRAWVRGGLPRGGAEGARLHGGVLQDQQGIPGSGSPVP